MLESVDKYIALMCAPVLDGADVDFAVGALSMREESPWIELPAPHAEEATEKL